MPTQFIQSIVLSILIILMSQTTAWPITNKTNSDVIIFSKESQTLTVKLDNTPLHLVLQQLANQLPVTITLRGLDGREPLSRSFTHLPFTLGIERLLQGHDYAIVYPRTRFIQRTLPKEIIVLRRTTISENLTSSESRIVMSPIIVQQDRVQSDSQSNKKDQKQSLTLLANRIEALVQELDQSHPPNFLQRADASQKHDSKIRAMARILIEQSEPWTP